MSAAPEAAPEQEQSARVIPFISALARVARRHRILDELAQNSMNRAHVSEMTALYNDLGCQLDRQRADLQKMLREVK